MLASVLLSSGFSAPPSLTRRDMFAGMGAAAAAVVAQPASAVFTTVPQTQNYQDRLNAARAEKNRLPDGRTPYEALISSTAKDAEKPAPPSGSFYSNGKGPDGVSYRTPSDPNGCSEVCALALCAPMAHCLQFTSTCGNIWII